MSDFKKKVTKPPGAAKVSVPFTPMGNTRTFDMRPKPSAERRHEGPVYRPPRHEEPEFGDPLESGARDPDTAE